MRRLGKVGWVGYQPCGSVCQIDHRKEYMVSYKHVIIPESQQISSVPNIQVAKPPTEAIYPSTYDGHDPVEFRLGRPPKPAK
jgi:hypothetical protein